MILPGTVLRTTPVSVLRFNRLEIEVLELAFSLSFQSFLGVGHCIFDRAIREQDFRKLVHHHVAKFLIEEDEIPHDFKGRNGLAFQIALGPELLVKDSLRIASG